MPPVDGLTLLQSEPAQGLVKVELAVLDDKGKPWTEFHPGDKIKFSLKNTGEVKVCYELIATDVKESSSSSRPANWSRARSIPRGLPSGTNRARSR